MAFPLILLVALSAAVSSQGLLGSLTPRISIPSTLSVSSVGSLLSHYSKIPLLSNVQNFSDFVKQTGKIYTSAVEKTFREGIFKANQVLIDSNNKAFDLGQSTFKLGANLFSDLSKTEFISKLTGLKRSSVGDSKALAHRQTAFLLTDAKIPESFDWREKGGVTPVKFQGLECNSCWSFAVTGAIEGHNFRKTNYLVQLSEQNLIDCSSSYGNIGCEGGYQEYGFEYIIENGGIAKCEKYPYKMKTDECQYKNNIESVEIKAFAVIDSGNEKKMEEVIGTLGPLACSISAGADSFVLYKEGIYNDEKCNNGELNHSILIVGYGPENASDYWIVKNSWTNKSGENGYIRIPKNKNNFCGIASECSYPIL